MSVPAETRPTGRPGRLPLCSDLSRTAGEDPIGTAPHWQEVTVLELGVPMWNRLRQYDAWTDEQRGVFAAMGERVRPGGAGFGLLMSAPDGRPNDQDAPLRLRHYVQGPGGYLRRDYQSGLPQSEWARGLHDTLIEPERLHASGDWEHVEAPCGPDLHVCTHGTVDAACGRYGVPVFQGLRNAGLRAWRTGHFGGHRFAATAAELPSGLFWAHLTPDLAAQVARREVSPAELRPHLRGFAGLPPLAQVLDRELLCEHGWDWLEADRSAAVEPHPEGGDRVTLTYDWRGERGTVSARVCEAEPLHLPGSSHEAKTSAVKQYALQDVNTVQSPAP